MAKRQRATSTTTIERRLKEGRGSGKGAKYNPWLHIQDVPSQGLCSRIKGWKTDRVHHLLSEMETNYFYVLEWSPKVLDIREQFPLLPLEETLAIADQCGFAHPSDPKTKEPIVMTTDFRVTVKQGTKTVEQARTVKYVKDLQSQRILEKLEIERCYWQKRGIDWGIVTERDVPNTVAANVKWLHPCLHLTDITSLTPSDILRIFAVMTPMVSQTEATLADITATCDDRLGLAPGLSLSVARHLLANRCWRVDMHQTIHPNQRLRLLAVMPIETAQASGELA
ncbi:TnsA endonuclease N-terminal domain-containing protein [Stenomitos frigidus]|uniref:Heteromeric transposase endonuclease subunit TnsA n=1 Tax=Stenomitos frigidus ULC18 TaxID=2107698 RepID=A0A2T1ENT2_9CYAN|nr:TnsA endonuclease N-terminal domain-containing protein [Stenomitos frigidus]PSB34399.1 heteromeric transposase endonuclease subunit TnsA [Stenomitos frigidus ULC18]